MIEVFLVGCGGFIGAALRYLCSTFIGDVYSEAFPLATFFVNVLGSFLIGFASVFIPHLFPEQKQIMLFATTGVLGGFTTFSTFSLEVISLFEDSRFALGSIYALGSVASCVLGVFLGRLAARVFCG